MYIRRNIYTMKTIHSIQNLHQLLEEDCRNFSVIEIELQHSLPIWITKSSSVKLKNILQQYHEQVKQHIKMIELFIEEENIIYINSGSNIMKAFISETEDKISSCSNTTVRDASILASVQNINHFKIASYGTAAAFADTLGMAKTALLFRQFESNEKHIDDRLSQLAINEINKEAGVELLTR